MIKNSAIPIIIGITGHRNINDQDIQKIKKVVKGQIEDIVFKCPNTPIKLLCCLAKGADQLCAEVAYDLGIDVIVPLPMEISEYQKDFDEKSLQKFNELLKKAEKSFIVPCVEETRVNGRDYFYRQADIYIAEHSNCLIGLWDGTKPKKMGCGSAETIDMVLNHTYKHNQCIRNNDGYVIHIYVNRDNISNKTGTVNYLGNKELFETTINKVEEINKSGKDPDKLSLENGNKYHIMLKLLAIFGTTVAIAFLLYDEVLLRGMLIVLGVILLFMFISYKYSIKSNHHKNYIEYRELAECLRIQKHLDKTGNNYEVADFLDWSRCFDTLWIYKIMKAICVDKKEEAVEEIKRDWLFDQYKYHENAAVKTNNMIKDNNIIIKISLIVSIVTYIYALVYEYVPILRISTNIELVRTIIKIIVGGFSAISLFSSNYYGKLSLQRVYEDHIRMSCFFKNSINYVDKNGVDEKFIKELIREELSENSNWCSYEKDNELNITI